MSFDSLCDTIKECNRCSLCQLNVNTTKQGIGFGKLVPSKGTVKVLFLGINPSNKRFADTKTAFVGRTTGDLMDSMMSQVGLIKEDYYWDNLIHCSTPDNREPTVDEIDCCHAYFSNLIQSENIRLVVCLGSLVSAYFGAEIGKIRKIKYSETLNGEVYVTALKHPAWVSYNDSNRSKYLEDLHVLKKRFDDVFNNSKLTAWS